MMNHETRTRQRALIGFLALLLGFAAIAWRLDRAPDIFTDEILYTRAGIRVAAEGALVWDNGEPLFVHPPLYFLVEGAYLALTRDPMGAVYAPGDIFAWVYHARYLNALIAGLTALLLYLLGRRLRGPWLGWLLVALFVLDPFGVRINRRAMLETMAAFLGLAGMALLLTAREPVRPGRAIVAGLLLGAALLTKELTFTTPLAVLLFGLLEGRRRPLTRAARWMPFLTVLVAGLSYLIFPLWALTTGRWDRFVHVKSLSLQRLIGLIHLSGWNRPEVSLWNFLLRRLTDYGSSYLLLALGGAATLWLLLFHRRERAGRLLGLWGLVLYPFYAFVTLVGSGNDQFFYFLLVPAILLVGYTATLPTPSAAFLPRLVNRWHRLALGILLLFILPYNAVRWVTTYGFGLDNGYRQLAAYVAEHLPADAPLNASGDAIKYWYFFPDRPIADAATPEEAQALGLHYFALAPKDVQGRYGRMTPALAAWIQAQGTRLFAVEGDSYGLITLYRVDYPGEDGPEPPSVSLPRFQRFQPAQAGFVDTLLVALGVWWAITIGLSLLPSPGLEASYDPA